MKKLFASLLAVFMAIPSAYAIHTNSNVWGAWGYGDGVKWDSAQDFIIDGCVGQGCSHGTCGDEWGLVGLIALNIVDHGGYFCPYQLQCANERKNKHTWTVYYLPNGYDDSKCVWLCEDGYGGENCEPIPEGRPSFCDPSIFTTEAEGIYSDISLRTDGCGSDPKESTVTGFSSWKDDYGGGVLNRKRDVWETDVLLGAIKFLQHGVIAAPIKAQCGRNNWSDIDSYVNTLHAAPDLAKLLCAPGYRANSDGTDCVAINQDVCEIAGMTLCAYFPRDSYTSATHKLYEDTEAGCTKYFCSEEGMAFQGVEDPTCVECGIPVKSGSNLVNGTCVSCDTGEYYDSETGTCKPANAYSKTDLQYGLNQTKNTQSDVDMQCWPAKVPEEYVECVKKGYRAPTDGKKVPVSLDNKVLFL